jgi:hypothetical protein
METCSESRPESIRPVRRGRFHVVRGRFSPQRLGLRQRTAHVDSPTGEQVPALSMLYNRMFCRMWKFFMDHQQGEGVAHAGLGEGLVLVRRKE